MKVGDHCLFYHSVTEKAVVGIAEVVKEFYSDLTTEDHRWYMMDIKPLKKLKEPVTLAAIRQDERLTEMQLVKYPRLSVQKVTEAEYNVIVSKSEVGKY